MPAPPSRSERAELPGREPHQGGASSVVATARRGLGPERVTGAFVSATLGGSLSGTETPSCTPGEAQVSRLHREGRPAPQGDARVWPAPRGRPGARPWRTEPWRSCRDCALTHALKHVIRACLSDHNNVDEIANVIKIVANNVDESGIW